MSHERRHSRAKLTVPCCLLRCLASLSPPPYPFNVVPYGCSPIIVPSVASSSRWRCVSAGDRTFIVCYRPAVPCSRCMTMLLEGRRRVSRDRPRCPVLHCRSPVWRRPTHRRHHVWLENRGRTRQKRSLSVRLSHIRVVQHGKVCTR
jgi:hypothetical protein